MAKSTVLFVDDEPYITKSLYRAFKRHFNVLTANSAFDALEVIGERKVDVVVSDQRMPNISGVELLNKVSQISPVTVRILLTGYADVDSAIAAVNSGEIYRYFNKPWKNSELKLALDDAATVADLTRESLIGETEDGFVVEKKILLTESDLSFVSFSSSPKLAKELGTIFNANKIYHARSASGVIKCISTRKNVAIIIAEIDIKDDAATELIIALKQRRPEILVLMINDQKDITKIVDLINYGQIFRVFSQGFSMEELKSNVSLAMSLYLTQLNSPELLLRKQAMNYTDAPTLSIESSSSVNESTDSTMISYQSNKQKQRIKSSKRVSRIMNKIRGIKSKWG